MFEERNGRLVYRYGSEIVWIEPWGEDSLRVRATKCARMPDMDWALLEPATRTAQIDIRSDSASIRNGNIVATVSPQGRIRFRNGAGRVLLEEYSRNRKPGSEYPSALDIDAREMKPIAGGDYSLTARFESDPNEKLFGMGQYQEPFLNRKGCVLELAQRNSQSSVPFVVSSLGYGFLWNNPAVGSVAFGRNLTEWRAFSTDICDYWITAGDTPAAIERAYASVTGTVPMMPEFAMGFWQCKLRYQTQEELLNVAREYYRRGVPLSVIVVDFFHWTCQGDWKFDARFWPDPEGMIRELADMGTKLMVSIWPTVDERSENYAEMREKGLLIRADRGVPISMTFQGNTLHCDVTNPEAREFLWNKAKANYYDKGVRVFWLDEAEPEYAYYDFDLYRYSLGSDVRVGNVFPTLYARAFADGMRAEGQEDVLNLIRCAWAGSQRYGALVWSGDIAANFRSMRCQLAAGLSMAMAGIPWWTTDIGGFLGGDCNDPAYREVLVRWFEWACYCPVMRLHGDREPHTPPLTPGVPGGGQLGSGGPNEIWSYGEDNYKILKRYIERREALKPYIAECMREAHEAGAPVMRPLFYEFPNDPAAWECEDEYLFGPKFLVAPVMEAGVDSRPVYLPVGARWLEIATGQEYAGGETVAAYAPLEVIPLFERIRPGA